MPSAAVGNPWWDLRSVALMHRHCTEIGGGVKQPEGACTCHSKSRGWWNRVGVTFPDDSLVTRSICYAQLIADKHSVHVQQRGSLPLLRYLFRFLPLDGLGLVRALRDMYEEPVAALQPHFGQQVIRHILRIRRREVPNHVK